MYLNSGSLYWWPYVFRICKQMAADIEERVNHSSKWSEIFHSLPADFLNEISNQEDVAEDRAIQVPNKTLDEQPNNLEKSHSRKQNWCINENTGKHFWVVNGTCSLPCCSCGSRPKQPENHGQPSKQCLHSCNVQIGRHRDDPGWKN